jgi:hypothetical protein
MIFNAPFTLAILNIKRHELKTVENMVIKAQKKSHTHLCMTHVFIGSLIFVGVRPSL